MSDIGTKLNEVIMERGALLLENRMLREALGFYANPEDWEQFISNGGIFDEQDGDPVLAFRNGEDTPWAVAEKALKKGTES